MAIVPLGVPARPLGPPRREPAAAHMHRDRYEHGLVGRGCRGPTARPPTVHRRSAESRLRESGCVSSDRRRCVGRRSAPGVLLRRRGSPDPRTSAEGQERMRPAHRGRHHRRLFTDAPLDPGPKKVPAVRTARRTSPAAHGTTSARAASRSRSSSPTRNLARDITKSPGQLLTTIPNPARTARATHRRPNSTGIGSKGVIEIQPDGAYADRRRAQGRRLLHRRALATSARRRTRRSPTPSCSPLPARPRTASEAPERQQRDDRAVGRGGRADRVEHVHARHAVGEGRDGDRRVDGRPSTPARSTSQSRVYGPSSRCVNRWRGSSLSSGAPGSARSVGHRELASAVAVGHEHRVPLRSRACRRFRPRG